MTNIVSKIGMGKICLNSFIILCSLLTSENAFSIHWDKRCTKFHYNQEANTISFTFLFHQYSPLPGEKGYLESLEFWYSKDRNAYTKLISASTKNQMNNNRLSITIHKKNHENVFYMTSEHQTSLTAFPEYRDVTIEVDAAFDENTHKTSNKAYLSIKWKLSEKVGRVNYFQIVGFWRADNKYQGNRIAEIYTLDHVKSNSNRFENIPSEFNSEIVNEVKVTGGTDAINVTGAEPGENIKVFTVSGVELKSVVATDDVVNIKLPTNQIYIVKAGQTYHKIAL